MRRICSCFLVFVLILDFTLPVYAADGSHTETETVPGVESETTAPERPSIASGSLTPEERVAQWTEQHKKNSAFVVESVVRQTLANLGVVMDDAKWKAFWEFYTNQESAFSGDDVMDWIDSTTGDVVVPSEVVQNIYNEVNNFLQQEEGFYIEPGLTHNLTWILNHLKYYTCIASASLSDYSEITGFMEQNNFFSFSPFNWQGVSNQCFFYGSSADYVVKLSDNRFYFYDKDLNLLEPNMIGRTDVFNYISQRNLNFSLQDIQGSLYPEIRFNSYSGPYWLDSYYAFKNDTKIFSSASVLNDYLYGEKSVYLMSGINNRIMDLNVSVHAIATDYREYNQQALNLILQAISNKKTELNVDTLTEQQLQEIIDSTVSDTLKDLLESIQNMGASNDQANELIYTKLEDIYKLLQKWDEDFEKDLTTGIDLKGISELFAVDKDLTDAPVTIFEQLHLEIRSVPDKILNGLDAHLDAALNKFFDEKLEPLLRELLVPDEETMDYTMSNIEKNLPFIAAGKKFTAFLQASLAEELVPVIYFGQAPDMDRFAQVAENTHTSLYPAGSFGGSGSGSTGKDNGHTEKEDFPAAFSVSSGGGSYVPPDLSGAVADHLGTDVLAFDFSWYEPYRFTVQRIIAGFIWLYFLWSVFHKLPRIIDGTASLVSKESD